MPLTRHDGERVVSSWLDGATKPRFGLVGRPPMGGRRRSFLRLRPADSTNGRIFRSKCFFFKIIMGKTSRKVATRSAPFPLHPPHPTLSSPFPFCTSFSSSSFPFHSTLGFSNGRVPWAGEWHASPALGGTRPSPSNGRYSVELGRISSCIFGPTSCPSEGAVVAAFLFWFPSGTPRLARLRPLTGT